MDQLMYALFGLGMVLLLCAVAVKGPGRSAPGSRRRPVPGRGRTATNAGHEDVAA